MSVVSQVFYFACKDFCTLAASLSNETQVLREKQHETQCGYLECCSSAVCSIA